MRMSILHTVRLVLFGLLLVFSLLVLGMSANLLNISTTQNDGSLPFEGLAVAVSVITFLTVIPIIVIDFIRRGAFTSFVVFEIAWVFVLMILWIAAAAETSATPIFIGGCSDFDDNDAASNCHQFQAIQAFAWLNFIILFGWLVTLIVGCTIQHTKGNTGVWKSPVSETGFFGAGSSAPGGAAAGHTSNPGYPPQHQYPGQPPVQMQQQQPSPQPGVQGSPQQQSTPQPATQESPSPHHHHHHHHHEHQHTPPLAQV